ncbi:efflux RND transporter periplasmic adaptor subunit [Candidatus Dependentiae bacterium]|nr:efflux RND transporter periplasmic adaptor subunit [Candidatus Dependentiae bacterium]
MKLLLLQDLLYIIFNKQKFEGVNKVKIKKPIIITSVILILIILTNLIYKKFFKKQPPKPYKTTTIQNRDIYQTINSTGKLDIKDTMKIGSLVGGTVKKIFVDENDIVKKEQLLALIDNGKDDTDVKRALGEVKNIKAELEYQEKYFKRQQELFKANQISQDFFEQVKKTLEQTKANLISAKANLRKFEIEYNNTKIIAPDDGTIISVGISEGERVTTDLDATVLFKIAKDLTKMEAELNIDESDIGQIKKGQKVKFNVSSYPDKTFKGFITSVSFSPNNKTGILSYKSYVIVENKGMLLRPGMTINAEIKVAKSKNCPSITTQAFQISSKLIKAVAEKLDFGVKKLDKQIKKTIEAKCNKKEVVKTVWIIENQDFIEKPVVVGITDDSYYEVISGLNEKDQTIIDIEEDDKLKKVYSKIFKSAI